MTDIAIIGGGPAGFMCAIAAIEANPSLKIAIFEKNQPMKSILCTGGGRCNLAYADFDPKTLAANFYRGEKFLYSVFSRFGAADTIDWFERHGLKIYMQDDLRIFPKSDKATDVQALFLNLAQKYKIDVIEQIVISSVNKVDDKFYIKSGKVTYVFDKVVIATGGNRLKIAPSGYDYARSLGHSVTDLRPGLAGLAIAEQEFMKLTGISAKVAINVYFENKFLKAFQGDFLFTHKGVSGHVVYNISSYCAMMNYNRDNPLKLEIDWVQEDIDKDFQEKLAQNSKKDILNIVAMYVTRALAEVLLHKAEIDLSKKANQISKEERQNIVELLRKTSLEVVSSAKDGEIVTAGGIDLNEINPKNMESKLVPNLYFCGEIMNIDGLTGGFNLQNCWSTGYLAGSNL